MATHKWTKITPEDLFIFFKIPLHYFLLEGFEFGPAKGSHIHFWKYLSLYFTCHRYFYWVQNHFASFETKIIFTYVFPMDSTYILLVVLFPKFTWQELQKFYYSFQTHLALICYTPLCRLYLSQKSCAVRIFSFWTAFPHFPLLNKFDSAVHNSWWLKFEIFLPPLYLGRWGDFCLSSWYVPEFILNSIAFSILKRILTLAPLNVIYLNHPIINYFLAIKFSQSPEYTLYWFVKDR